MKVSQGWEERTLLEGELELSASGYTGLSPITSSSALVMLPAESFGPGRVRTTGAGTVRGTSNSSYVPIALRDGKKELECKSPRGWWAKVRLERQRNGNPPFHYFSVFLGPMGLKEKIDESGEKNRPHLCFLPDGNGKFVRLSGYGMTIKTERTVDRGGQILPECITIVTQDPSGQLHLHFEHQEGVLTLVRAEFELEPTAQG